jgi:hypothetical protein
MRLNEEAIERFEKSTRAAVLVTVDADDFRNMLEEIRASRKAADILRAALLLATSGFVSKQFIEKQEIIKAWLSEVV